MDKNDTAKYGRSYFYFLWDNFKNRHGPPPMRWNSFSSFCTISSITLWSPSLCHIGILVVPQLAAISERPSFEIKPRKNQTLGCPHVDLSISIVLFTTVSGQAEKPLGTTFSPAKHKCAFEKKKKKSCFLA